jgi:uncharacterized protein
MRWQFGRRSGNIEDRRGMGGRTLAGGGIGALIIAAVFSLLSGDPTPLLREGTRYAVQVVQSRGQESRPPTEEEQQLADFVSVVLADTEDTWSAVFEQQNVRYQPPKLVLFSGSVDSACGFAQAAMGPFYCPLDRKVYIDLRFYQDLRDKLGAPGDFAQAYVIAHEVGHHLQTTLGISAKVREAQGRSSRREANALSVRQELQADCFAGIWAHHAGRTRDILEPGDIDEALNAASQIGDDRLQGAGGGQVVPDSFTHGSSAQRQRWFKRGFEEGRMEACDTFSARDL